MHFPFEMPARLSLPSVFTLHEPGRYLYPELMVRRVRDVQNDRLRRQLRDPNLRAVVTVSHASQADITVSGHVSDDEVEHVVRFTDPHDDKALAKAIVARCTEPGPPPEEVDRLLAAYSAAVAGPALLDVYRTAASESVG